MQGILESLFTIRSAGQRHVVYIFDFLLSVSTYPCAVPVFVYVAKQAQIWKFNICAGLSQLIILCNLNLNLIKIHDNDRTIFFRMMYITFLHMWRKSIVDIVYTTRIMHGMHLAS